MISEILETLKSGNIEYDEYIRYIDVVRFVISKTFEGLNSIGQVTSLTSRLVVVARALRGHVASKMVNIHEKRGNIFENIFEHKF